MAWFDGAFNILKPPGMSSHDLVRVVRKELKGIKIGHGGTLDPGASGVLPILVGRATKLTNFLLDYSKSYRGEVTLGSATTTDDGEGQILYTRKVPPLTESKLHDVLAAFEGVKEQIPPQFSAIKHKGKKYLDYARKGEEIPVKTRAVYIKKCKLLYFWPPHRIIIDIECSKGTYIRSIARDFGNIIGCGAHLSFLVRKSTGPFSMEESVTIEEFQNAAENSSLDKLLFTPEFCLSHFKKVDLSKSDAMLFSLGTMIDLGIKDYEANNPLEEYYRVYNQENEFLALATTVYKEKRPHLKPVVIFR